MRKPGFSGSSSQRATKPSALTSVMSATHQPFGSPLLSQNLARIGEPTWRSRQGASGASAALTVGASATALSDFIAGATAEPAGEGEGAAAAAATTAPAPRF